MMPITSKRTLTLTALALLAASCASGGPSHGRYRGHGGPPSGQRDGVERPSILVRPGALLLIDLDADHDLRISRAELVSGAAALFAQADTNHDGSLSPFEFDAMAQAHLGTSESTPGRLSFDVNADNAITLAEFNAGMLALFERFDADHDGFVTRAEMVERVADVARAGGEAQGAAPSGVHHRRGP